MRLGIPFAVYVLLIQPDVVYALEHPLGYAPGSYWQEFLGDEGALDTGPLWFVGVLLVYSLAYAGWVHLRAPAHPDRCGGVGARHLRWSRPRSWPRCRSRSGWSTPTAGRPASPT